MATIIRVSEAQKRASAKWKLENPGRCNALASQYYARHKEAILQRRREKYALHKEAISALRKERYAEQKARRSTEANPNP